MYMHSLYFLALKKCISIPEIMKEYIMTTIWNCFFALFTFPKMAYEALIDFNGKMTTI